MNIKYVLLFYILPLFTLLDSSFIAYSANAPRTAINYGKSGAVAWDGTMIDAYHMMEIFDFTGDGKLDLRLGNYRYANSGTNIDWTLPKFESGTSLSLPQSGRGFRIDYDSDGDHDFIYKDEIRYYENTGSDASPTWVDRGKIQANGSNITNDFSAYKNWNNYGSPSIAWADWDSDGKNDLVISVCDRIVTFVNNTLQRNVYSQGRVHFYRNTGTNSSPSFAAVQKLQSGGSDLNLPYRGYINVVDYDGDTDLEIVSGSYDGKIRVIEQNTSATDCYVPSVIATTYDLMQDLRTVDLDSDGDYDIVFLSASGLYNYEYSAGVYSYWSRADISNGSSVSLRADTFMMPWAVDWENDGDLDLITGGENGYISLFRNANNDTSKQFNDAERIAVNSTTYNQNARAQGSYRWGPFEGSAGYTTPIVVDWDDDGDLDIVTQDAEYANTYFLENTGTRSNPSFGTARQTLTLNGGSFTHMWRTRPAIADYDDDGDLDLLLVNASKKIKVYSRKGASDTDLEEIDTVENSSGGDLTIEYPQTVVGMCPMQAVDINGDGLFDLVIGAYATGFKLQYYRNVGTLGSPAFAAKEYIKNADGTDYISATDHEPHTHFVDWDKDGKLDLIDCHPRSRFTGNDSVYFVDGDDLFNYASNETIRDNTDGAYTSTSGSWTTSSGVSGYYGTNYHHDGNAGATTSYKNFKWTAALAQAGTYDVYLRWAAASNRASNTWVIIKHNGTRITTTVNQKNNGGVWVKVASDKYFSTSTASGQNEVFVVNRHDDGVTWADGYVIADAVRFVKK